MNPPFGMGEGSFVERYRVADCCWELTTNAAEILEAARRSFPQGRTEAGGCVDFRINIDVSGFRGSRPWRNPICRGRDHLAFCCLGDDSAIIFDYRTRSAAGWVTQAVAEDLRYWREVVFPLVLGLMSPVLHAVPLHAACVQYRGKGVLIGARSGAGKSTLAATLARRGIEFISDDWVYLTSHRGLRAHALPVPLKLLPDAPAFFPELSSLSPAPAQNGEWSIAFHPEEAFQAPRAYASEPETVVLFTRVPGAELSVREASESDLLDWFSEPLDCIPACLDGQRKEQIALILSLRACRCYVMSDDGSPEKITADLLRLCDGEIPISTAAPASSGSGIEHLDLLSRGIPAECTGVIDLEGMSVSVVTNDEQIFDTFDASASQPEFDLTVINETQPWPESTVSAPRIHNSLGYASFGADGLIAFDLAARTAVAFVTPAAIEALPRPFQLLDATRPYLAAGAGR